MTKLRYVQTILFACLLGAALRAAMAGPEAVAGTPGAPAVGDTHTVRIFGTNVPPCWSFSNTVEGLVLTLQTPGFEARRIASDGCALYVFGPAARRFDGAPDMPTVATVLPGRPGFRAVLQDTRVVSQPMALEVAPSIMVLPPPPGQSLSTVKPQTLRRRDPAIYGRSDDWPTQTVRVAEAWIGTQKYVRVECSPFRYNPRLKSLEWNRLIETWLRFVPSP